MRRVRMMALSIATAATVALAAGAAPASATTLLRLNGIGPLTLGMLRTDAVDTGWLSNRSTGCELGGTPLPITYRLHGPKAPSGLTGTVEARGGHLKNIVVTRGAKTALGVTVRTTTTATMAARYRAAGYTVQAGYDNTFQGTFVNVSRNGKMVIGGFGRYAKVTTLGVPYIPVCE